MGIVLFYLNKKVKKESINMYLSRWTPSKETNLSTMLQSLVPRDPPVASLRGTKVMC